MAEKKTKKESTEKQPVVKAAKKEPKKAAAAEKAAPEKEIRIKVRLADTYKKEIVPGLKEKFAYKSVMQVPKLHKVVVNMGLGAAVADQKILEEAVKELETITGQKASIRKAKKAISNFKLREGVNIGAMVTLRRRKNV